MSHTHHRRTQNVTVSLLSLAAAAVGMMLPAASPATIAAAADGVPATIHPLAPTVTLPEAEPYQSYTGAPITAPTAADAQVSGVLPADESRITKSLEWLRDENATFKPFGSVRTSEETANWQSYSPVDGAGQPAAAPVLPGAYRVRAVATVQGEGYNTPAYSDWQTIEVSKASTVVICDSAYSDMDPYTATGNPMPAPDCQIEAGPQGATLSYQWEKATGQDATGRTIWTPVGSTPPSEVGTYRFSASTPATELYGMGAFRLAVTIVPPAAEPGETPGQPGQPEQPGQPAAPTTPATTPATTPHGEKAAPQTLPATGSNTITGTLGWCAAVLLAGAALLLPAARRGRMQR